MNEIIRARSDMQDCTHEWVALPPESYYKAYCARCDALLKKEPPMFSPEVEAILTMVRNRLDEATPEAADEILRRIEALIEERTS